MRSFLPLHYERWTDSSKEDKKVRQTGVEGPILGRFLQAIYHFLSRDKYVHLECSIRGFSLLFTFFSIGAHDKKGSQSEKRRCQLQVQIPDHMRAYV